MNRLKFSSALLSVSMFGGLTPVCTHADIIDAAYDTYQWAIGTPEINNPLCEGYPDYQIPVQKICDRYTEKNTQEVAILPASQKLKENTLYLVSESNNTLIAPYDVPAGTSIIPTPGVDLNLIPTGVGSDDDCGLCVVKLNESSRVAGTIVDIPKASWKSIPKAGKPRAVIFIKGKTAEFSVSTVTGSQDFDSLIYSQVETTDNMIQSFKELVLYTNGSQYGIQVENTASTVVAMPDVATRHVEILGTIVVLSGTPTDKTLPQAGISLNNLLVFMGGSQVAFSELPATVKALRVGLKVVDTASLWLDKNVFSLATPSVSRAEDIQISLGGKKNSKMTLFADGNSLSSQIQSFEGQYNSDFKVTMVRQNNLLYSDLSQVLDRDTIAKLTSTGGVFYGSALKIPAICAAYNESDFNKTYPFPPTNSLGEAAPINATLISFEEKFTQCEAKNNCSWRDFPLEIAGLAVSSSIFSSIIMSTIIGVCCYRVGALKGREGYTPITNN